MPARDRATETGQSATLRCAASRRRAGSIRARSTCSAISATVLRKHGRSTGRCAGRAAAGARDRNAGSLLRLRSRASAACSMRAATSTKRGAPRFERALCPPAGVPAGEGADQSRQHAHRAAAAGVRPRLICSVCSPSIRSPLDGWYLLGFLHERRGELREAIAPYEKSMALQARPAHGTQPRSRIRPARRLRQAAARMMQLALQLDPEPARGGRAQLAFSKRRLCDWSGPR